MLIRCHEPGSSTPQPLGSAAAVAWAAARSQSLVPSLFTTIVGVRRVASRSAGTLKSPQIAVS